EGRLVDGKSEDHAGPQPDRPERPPPRHAARARPRQDRPHLGAGGRPGARRHAEASPPSREGGGRVAMAERKLNLTDHKPAQPRKDRKRVGRGPGSGKGRYAGRGIKGQKSRSGSHKMRAGFEGGLMPIYMRIGKLRGSTSKDAMPVGPFRTFTHPINLRDLDRFDAGDVVTPESLVEKGLIKNTKTDIKLLGNGDVSKKLTIRVHAISASAR